MSKAAVFLDRDGVINANRADHVLGWDEFEFLPGVLKALAALHAAGLPVLVVTNQAAVSRGQLERAALAEIHARMAAAVQAANGRLLDVLYCPHDASAACDCRKPRPGLFLRAAERHGIDLGASYYVGDALTDVHAGQAAGCTAILVRTGRGRTQVLREEARLVRDYYLADNLQAAARWIIARHSGSSPGWLRPRVSLRSALERW